MRKASAFVGVGLIVLVALVGSPGKTRPAEASCPPQVDGEWNGLVQGGGFGANITFAGDVITGTGYIGMFGGNIYPAAFDGTVDCSNLTLLVTFNGLARQLGGGLVPDGRGAYGTDEFGGAWCMAVTPRHCSPSFFDNDGDGIANSTDNCLDIANPGQANVPDGNIIVLRPLKAFDDLSRPLSDDIGDACDTDNDNDGLEDADELTGANCGGRVTDPTHADTDGDNYLDAAECSSLTGDPGNLAVHPTPNECGPSTDDDGDRVLAFRERCFYNTAPLLADTDGDGCNDGREVASINTGNAVDVIDLQQIASEHGSYQLPGNAVKVDFDITKNGTIDVIDLQQAAGLAGACP